MSRDADETFIEFLCKVQIGKGKPRSVPCNVDLDRQAEFSMRDFAAAF